MGFHPNFLQYLRINSFLSDTHARAQVYIVQSFASGKISNTIWKKLSHKYRAPLPNPFPWGEGEGAPGCFSLGGEASGLPAKDTIGVLFVGEKKSFFGEDASFV